MLLFLVEQGRAVWEGQGQGQEKGKTQQQVPKRALILWRRPDEWGRLIRDWIVATGQDKSIMTFFELTEGDLVEDQGECSEPGVVRTKGGQALRKSLFDPLPMTDSSTAAQNSPISRRSCIASHLKRS